MMPKPNFYHRHAARILAILLILGAYWFIRLPQLPQQERLELATRFHFSSFALTQLPSYPVSSERRVNPSLEHISGWISSVGASVAMNDLDGDGLPNDICYVDTPTNQVIIQPAPSQMDRYEPFTLNTAPLHYDDTTMAPMGCLLGDLNEDGRMDALVYYWGRTPMAFLNKSSGELNITAASFRPVDIVPGEERWFTNAVTSADVDGDGHVDLIIGNYFPDGSHILDANATSPENMQHSMSRAYNGGQKHFLLWSAGTSGPDPTVSYQQQNILTDQVAHGWTLAIAAADFDNDLRPEIYFANDFGPDRLLYNNSQPGELNLTLLNGQRKFTTPRSKVLGQDSFKGMGVDVGDIDNNGRLDMSVSNITSQLALLESNFMFMNTGQITQMAMGIAPFNDLSESLGLSRSGWSWDIKMADFDNNGQMEVIVATGFVRGATDRWPELQELAMGNDDLLRNPNSWPRFQAGDDLNGRQHNPFFVRAKDGRFYDLAKEIGLGQDYVSRGIAIADVDGNGSLDLAVANQWDISYFYQNTCQRCGSFLQLYLLLPPTGAGQESTVLSPGHPSAGTLASPAVGATAILHLPDGQVRISQVDGGNGHSGRRSADLHFGLGDFPPDQTIQVELRWRDRSGNVHQEKFEVKPGPYTLILSQKGK